MKKPIILLLSIILSSSFMTSCASHGNDREDSSSDAKEDSSHKNEIVKEKGSLCLVAEWGGCYEQANFIGSVVIFEKERGWWEDRVSDSERWHPYRDEYKHWLTRTELNEIENIKNELDGISYEHPIEVKGDYCRYTFYVNGNVIATGYSCYLTEFPEEVQKALKYIKEMAPKEISFDFSDFNK